MTKYRLFGEIADRYDLHTPPSHYQHDHDFVIEIARRYGDGARLLDIGCGTGAFVAKARSAGIDAYGIDSAPEMIAQCDKRLGAGIGKVLGMADLAAVEEYDVICMFSWTLHYAESIAQVLDILKRIRRALRKGGTMALQVAHAEHADGQLKTDWELGPTGIANDVALMYRFMPLRDANASLLAQYTYLCWSKRELVSEDHKLVLADASRLLELASDAGFGTSQLFDSWHKEPFAHSLSPFLVAICESKGVTQIS